MKLKHFSHEHALQFHEDQGSHLSDDQKAYCSGCGELVCGPSFSCVACRFYLDKKCAEAPSELNHPFHGDHSFRLLKRHRYSTKCPCDFCGKACENFVYHCSCDLDLHVRCALFSYNLAKEGVGELQHIAHIDPLIISTENRNLELKGADCFACWKPLLESVYLSPDCGFYLHVKCADLSPKINHLLHPQHPLILQFITFRFNCNICKKTQIKGFVYCCSSCDDFVLHIQCATLPTTINHLCHRKHPLDLQFIRRGLPCQICEQTKHKVYAYCCSICKLVLHPECAPKPPIVEDKSHQHPFIPFWRSNVSFTCDACGTPGNFLSYICSTCSIMVHKKCISLPRTLEYPMHPEHPIFHTHLLGQDQNEIAMWECQICHLEEVNAKHARYRCSPCDYNVHVNCAIEDYEWYEFDESGTIVKNLEENSALLPPYSVIKDTKQGENVVAKEIKHFIHQHNLILSNDIKDDKFCDGCVLCISTGYYHCLQCNFSLHKSCAELPRKKSLWFHFHPEPVPLISSHIFKCASCYFETNGFAYICEDCNDRFCLPCVIVSARGYKCEAHEHLLSFYMKHGALCNACGESVKSPYRCKGCNFSLHEECMKLPLKVRHSFDEHPFILTYHDDNDYSESHHCDICEEERNPNHWFYHCVTCNNSAHPDCVLGEYRFIKLGSIYTERNHHPHPLTFVQKVHYYPECNICGVSCLDLALECKEMGLGCSYIVHWKCIKPDHLKDKEEETEDEDEDEEEEEEE